MDTEQLKLEKAIIEAIMNDSANIKYEKEDKEDDNQTN